MTTSSPFSHSKDIYRRFAEATSDAMGMFSLDLQFSDANDGMREMLGIDSNAKINEVSFADFLLPEDKDHLFLNVIPAVLQEDEAQVNLTLIAPDKGQYPGTQYHVRLHLYLTRNDVGAPMAFAVIIRDSTEQVRTHNSLHIYQKAIESSLNAVAVADMAGHISYVNTAFCKVWHLSDASEAVGRTVLDFWSEPNHAASVVTTLHQHSQWQGEMVGRRQDGSNIDLEVSAHLLKDHDGKPLCMISSFVDITARRVAERELQYEHDFAMDLLRTAPIIMLLMNLDGTIRYINPFLEQLSGYRVEEVKGLDWFDTFLPQGDRARIRSVFKGAVNNIRVRGNTNPIVTRSGELCDIEWNDQLLLNADGQPDAILAVGVDVSKRQQQEQQLRQSETQLKEAQRIARVGSWELNLRSNHLSWTDEIFHLFELDPANFEASYEAFLEAIHPEDRGMVDQAYQESLKNRSPYVITHRLLMSDGRTKWVEERCKTEFSEEGEPLVSQGTVQDITERVELEHQLRKLNEQLELRVAERSAALFQQNQRNEAILRTTPDGFIAIDIRGQILHANPAFCAMLGYQESELCKKNIMDIGWLNTLEELEASTRRILEHGYHRFETCLTGRVEQQVAVEVTVSLVEIEKGKVFYAFTRDITQRKESESALIQAFQEAERANTAKSEFLSRMSHELRTPLNAILGFGQLLQADSSMSLDQQENAQEIVGAGAHLLRLVNEVLDLSKVENGHLDLELKSIVPMPLIESCVSQIKPLANKRRVTIRVLPIQGGSVLADEMRLKQVMINLLSNAIKYNRDGGWIGIGFEQQASQFRIKVMDSGIGIPLHLQERLFQPFERMVSAYHAAEGTGIGLALAKQLMEAMAGQIGYESLPEGGSCFWIELPLLSEAAIHSKGALNGLADFPNYTANKQHVVLYVEDNSANLRLVQKLLERRPDVKFIYAVDGKCGLTMIQQQQPDLVLLDINLPGMDGYELLRHIHGGEPTSRIPVIAVSANAMPKDIEYAKENGFTDYLTKPIEVTRFYELIDRNLKGS